MASGREEEEQIPLDIDNVHLLLQVEQEQIQKRTFTNWINAQLGKHRTPTVVLDLFTDVRDGNRLLDLLEVISGQPMSRERGRSIFQCRANIETALTFLRRKSIKLVNINIPDIIEGKPSIVLGLIWTIILHFHIEELASSLAFSSRQSSMESLASIDSCSTIDSSSPRRSGTLHTKFKLSAKKALLLWAREQCHKAGANISIKDFKSSWRSGLAFLAILNSLRPNLVDLQKTKGRTNRENLEEAFRTAEHELKIPRLLEPEDVDISDPDDKSIMTYVAQFLQYSKDLPVSEEEMQGNLTQKVKGVTSWLTQAEQELEGSIGEADKESYEEKFHAFQTFVTTFNEQKRPIMPLLTAMRKTTQLTEDQVRLKEAWNKVTSKIREYKVSLDLDLPSPLNGVGVWLQKIEPVLGEEIAESQDHEEAAGRIRDTLHLLKSLMEEMDVHWQTLQNFPNKDENGATRVPQEKMDELKRRFTSLRVTAKYHGIKLEYQESKYSVQALICAVNSKLNTWKTKYGTKESVKLLQLDWHDFIEKQSFVTRLEAATEKLKLIASNYTSRTALVADSQYINKFLKQVDCDSSVSLESIRNVKAILSRVVSSWDTYTENYNFLQQWLKEAQTQMQIHTAEITSDWSTRHARLNEAGNFLMEVTNEQTSSQLSEELKKLNRQWADFIKRTTFEIIPLPCESPRKTNKTAAINMIDEATQMLHERFDISTSSLRTYIKRLEDLKRKLEAVDLDFIPQSSEKSPVEFPPVKNVKDTLSEITDKCSGIQQDCQCLLGHVDTLESSLASLELWESEARDIFNSLNTKQKGQVDKKSLQLLIARGKEFERQVETAQEIVLVAAKSRSLHHLQASGLQSRVNAVNDTLQVTMTNLNSAMETKEPGSSSEADIKLRFESSKQKLQAYITDVVALLSEKHTSEERVAKHEETLTRSETDILEEFLEASENMKQITPSNQQQEVEKISKCLREQWEACFSPKGSLGQADDHLQAMKGICEKLAADTSYSVAKTQLTECEQRKEEIEQRARHVYENLLTRHNEQQSSEKRHVF
ncbi:nesprin-2a [Polyodon spathula]|uniref:nesprin-2a n=1 Tax=Polyodon spathula TaxID=7913 RepID=UPI001B7DD307|nr:nesprin-2a [Polyodon spathula]